MRIAVVTQFFPVREQPYRGHSAYQTLRPLAQMADVRVFAPFSHYPNFLRGRHRSWAHTDETYQPPETQASYFNYPAIPVLTRAVNGLSCARSIDASVTEFRPDVILSYWLYPDGWAAARVAKKLGVFSVATAIGSDVNDIRDPITRHMTKQAVLQSDHVVTVSTPLRSRVISDFGVSPERVSAVLNGCDLGIFRVLDRAAVRRQLAVDLHDELIVYVGRLDVLKGLLELTRACAELQRKRPRLRLVMIGEGPAKPEIVSTAELEGFNSRLTLVPPCPSTMIAQWMNAADVFSIPSYAEGCPNVVIEAQNCGTPVVATRVGGIPELVSKQSALLVEARSVPQLISALDEALQRPWDRIAIGNAQARSWRDVAGDLYALFEKLRMSPKPDSRLCKAGG